MALEEVLEIKKEMKDMERILAVDRKKIDMEMGEVRKKVEEKVAGGLLKLRMMRLRKCYEEDVKIWRPQKSFSSRNSLEEMPTGENLALSC